MINFKITRYREFTDKEKAELEEGNRKNNYNTGFNSVDLLTPMGRSMYQERILDVEITNEQFEAIRKAVLENF